MIDILKYFFLSVVLLLSTANNIYAQTYETPELKQNAEKEQADKLEWIQNNPEEYRKQGGNPEAYIKANTKTVEKPIEVIRYKSPVNIKDKSLFKLMEITAVDLNHKHTEQEMIAFSREAQSEFDLNNIVVDIENKRWYYIPRNDVIQPYFKNFNINNDIIQFTNCKDCEDNTFAIIEQTSKSLIVQLKPQDIGQFFVYQLKFAK